MKSYGGPRLPGPWYAALDSFRTLFFSSPGRPQPWTSSEKLKCQHRFFYISCVTCSGLQENCISHSTEPPGSLFSRSGSLFSRCGRTNVNFASRASAGVVANPSENARNVQAGARGRAEGQGWAWAKGACMKLLELLAASLRPPLCIWAPSTTFPSFRHFNSIAWARTSSLPWEIVLSCQLGSLFEVGDLFSRIAIAVCLFWPCLSR